MALEQIEQRVNDIYNLLAVGIGQSSLTQRVEKIESALYSGSGSGIVISSASIAEVLSSTNFVTGVSGWRITKSGDVEFQSGVFRGDITATSGFFSGTVYVGATSNRIIIDGPNKLLRSENYVAGTSGWQIEGDGDAEFQDGIFRGAITAESGSFVGNVTVGTGGSFSSGQTAYNTGTGFWLEANAGTPRFSLGIPGSAGLTWNGSTLTVNGAFTATSGNITGTLYVGASAPRIIIDGSTKVIKSENYSAGVAGWQIDKDGLAEFQNVVVRGSLQSTVFSYNEVSAIGGQSYVVQRAGTLKADVTTSGAFSIDITDPDSGHVQLFAVNDILRVTDAGTTNWLTVTSVSDQTTFWRYACNRSNGTATTFRAGTAVLSYGVSGDGYILMDAQAATGPFISVATHAGFPWTTITERVRIGNLNGWGPFSTDIFGFALGDYAASSYLYFDPATSNTKIVNGNGSVILDKNGLSITFGTADANKLSWITGATFLSQAWTEYTAGSTVGTSWAVLDRGAAISHSLKLYTRAKTGTLFSFISMWSGDSTAPSTPYIEQSIGDSAGFISKLKLTPNIFSYDYDGSTLFSVTNVGVVNITDLHLLTGATVSQFSTDGTLADNADNAVPTEQAVRTYVSDKALLKVQNTSGATASANDMGYIDTAGEYKTTTTASSLVAWCVVVTGGANNTAIYVTRRGRVTVKYTGTAPSTGHFLVTSTVAGSTLGQSTVDPAILAVCLAAGSGGVVEALLLCQRTYTPLSSTNDLFRVDSASAGNFTGTINGAPSGSTLVYTITGATNENTIKPSSASELAKMTLHNTTRGTSLLIDSVDLGTNTITFTASVPGAWVNTDVITTRSQTNTDTASGAYFFDYDLSSADNTVISALAVSLSGWLLMLDSGSGTLDLHPFAAFAASKDLQAYSQTGNAWVADLPLTNRKFCIRCQASGSATATFLVRLTGAMIATP